jgi:hypothetical protein
LHFDTSKSERNKSNFTTLHIEMPSNRVSPTESSFSNTVKMTNAKNLSLCVNILRDIRIRAQYVKEAAHVSKMHIFLLSKRSFEHL